MGNYRKLYTIAASILTFLALSGGSAHAIGEFSLGLNAGVAYGVNEIDTTIDRFNTAMKGFQNTLAGTEVNQLRVPYTPVVGLNVRYQFNFLLFRLGWHFTSLIQPVQGSITPATGVKNEIEIFSLQHSMPASIGLIIPLKKRTYFFIGAGGTFHISYTRITQSNPDQPGVPFDFNTLDSSLSKNRRDRYYKEFVGYHFIMGAEVPVGSNVTITTEWIHQDGRSFPMDNEGKDAAGLSTSSPRKSISARGDFLLFGISYYISM